MVNRLFLGKVESDRRSGFKTLVPTFRKRHIFGWAISSLKVQYMQQEVSLYELQMNQASDEYALIGGYRVSVDYAQGAVHFYAGEQEWGKLAGTLPVEKWSGDWLIRTIGRFFRIDYQLSEEKTIASIQRNGYLTIQTGHKIGKAILYRRILLDRTWDYCIGFRGDVGFGSSVENAVAELRGKLNARINVEQAEVTLSISTADRTRPGHFTEQQLAAFCEANGLKPGGSYSRQHLRQTILRQRKLNCEQFRNQLYFFDIRINCK